MKKFFLIVLITTLACTGYYTYKNLTKTKAEIYDEKLDKLQDEIDKTTKERQDEQLRKIKLQELQNPEIINSKLSEAGKIVVYKGNTKYADIITESNFWGSKTLDIELIYNFGISIDLNEIVVSKFYDTTAVLQIPKNKILLEYVELNMEETKISGKKTWFNFNYSPEDVKLILNNAQTTVKSKIEQDKSIFDESMINLKETINDFVLKLGYENVIFEEI